MAALRKLRIGIAILVAGESVALVTQAWHGPLAFISFAVFGVGLVALGMVVAIWGAIQYAAAETRVKEP
jgi:hypothetical protein